MGHQIFQKVAFGSNDLSGFEATCVPTHPASSVLSIFHLGIFLRMLSLTLFADSGLVMVDLAFWDDFFKQNRSWDDFGTIISGS